MNRGQKPTNGYLIKNYKESLNNLFDSTFINNIYFQTS